MSPVRGQHLASDLFAGSGLEFESIDPATGEVLWVGKAAGRAEVDAAVSAAREAFPGWQETPVARRIAIIEAFAERLRAAKPELASIISRETGKPVWEAILEVDAMAGKAPLSIAAMEERRRPTTTQAGGVTSATRYKPFGVLAVVGPFNMPGHLPNGHIIPALLAGNCVVFKPSELTPWVGQKTAELWQSAGLPPGVLTLVQGGRETGVELVRHPLVDGVLFTGSVAGGVAIGRTLIDQPGKIVALEMGGNNPLVAWDARDATAAAYLVVQSAFITSGQRCSCARRLIVSDDDRGQALLDRLVEMTKKLRVGSATDRPEPFMGPVISDAAAMSVLNAQRALIESGGKALLEAASLGPRPALLSPGIVDVTTCTHRPDEEIFGPLLQVIRMKDFDAALREANNTRFGLAAGLLSDDLTLWEKFYRHIRAGVVYWNRQTTGGSSALPFGGTGLSGNHRPSGYFAADYCSYPVASMETRTLRLPEKLSPGIEAI